MSQLAIYRDVWGLFPANKGYPGAFPQGLINKIRKKWWGQKRLWLFSGSFKDKEGVMIDIKKEVNPSIVANCEDLPFKDEIFDFIMIDPPYSEKESKELYNLPYCNIIKVMNEASRVCRPGGYVLLLHRLLTFYHPSETIHKKRLQLQGIVGVYVVAGYSNIRALSIFRKNESLDDFILPKI